MVTHQTLQIGRSYQNTYTRLKSSVSTDYMTLAVDKSCKITLKSEMDDVIHMSQMSQMPQNIFNVQSFKSMQRV